MSDAMTSFGLHVHKYKVGDTFDFDGIMEIVALLHKTDEQGNEMYRVKMPDGKLREVDEKWIDGGCCHFNLDENGRVIGKEYTVSYIAEAPQEFKVGDRVEVVYAAFPKSAIGCKGTIIEIKDSECIFKYDDTQYGNTALLNMSDLRKLPDIDNPLDRQVGGSHYKDMAIQPVEFCMKNNLDFCTSSAIKYLCRRKKKNGKEDLLKAKHFIDLLIQLEYPE